MEGWKVVYTMEPFQYRINAYFMPFDFTIREFLYLLNHFIVITHSSRDSHISCNSCIHYPLAILPDGLDIRTNVTLNHLNTESLRVDIHTFKRLKKVPIERK